MLERSKQNAMQHITLSGKDAGQVGVVKPNDSRQHITLSGKDYPVAFGYGALMEYEAMTGKSALSLLTEGAASLTDTFTLIACALTNGAEKAGNPQSFSPKFAADLIDGTPNSVEVVTQIMRLLESSFATDESAKKKTMYPNRETRRKAG